MKRLQAWGLALLGCVTAAICSAMPPVPSCKFDNIHVGAHDELRLSFWMRFGPGGLVVYDRADDTRWTRADDFVASWLADDGRHGLYAVGRLTAEGTTGVYHAGPDAVWRHRGPARDVRVVSSDGTLYACDRLPFLLAPSMLAYSGDNGRSWSADVPAPGDCNNLMFLAGGGELYAFGYSRANVSHDRGKTWQRIEPRLQSGGSFEVFWNADPPRVFVDSQGHLFASARLPSQREDQPLRWLGEAQGWEVLPLAWPPGTRADAKARLVAVQGGNFYFQCHVDSDYDYPDICVLQAGELRPLQAGRCASEHLAPGAQGQLFTMSTWVGLCVGKPDAGGRWTWQQLPMAGLPDANRFDCRVREE